MSCQRLRVMRLVAVFCLGISILAGCGKDDADLDDHQDGAELKATSAEFVVDGRNAVAYVPLNVLVPGTVLAEFRWKEDEVPLEVSLEGRSSPENKRSSAAVAKVSGKSPLRLQYEVSREDIARGIHWRILVSGVEEGAEASGTVQIKFPFDAESERVFERKKIALLSGDIQPSVTLQQSFKSRLAAASGDGLHGVISLKRTIDCVQARQLAKLGIVRQTKLSGTHYFGFVRKGIDFNHPLIASVLEYVTPLDPIDRVEPHIWLGNYGRFQVTPPDQLTINYVLNEDGTVRLSVLFAPDVPLQRTETILRAETIDYTTVTDVLWLVTIKPERVKDLAGYDEVEWIEAGPVPPLPTNDGARQSLNVDVVQNATINAAAGTINYVGLTGAGVTAGVCDSGVDAGHPDLNVVLDLGGAHYHGTHVAGTIAGSGAQSNQNDISGTPNAGTPFQWRGVAPNAAIIDAGLESAATLLSAIQTNSLDLSNHSHIFGLDGNYDASNRAVDQVIRGGASSSGTAVPRRPQIQTSANNGGNAQYGNITGYFSNLNQTKNAIVCGAWDDGNNRLAGFSSMGPAHDGRLKPDVLGPGVGIKSTKHGHNEVQSISYLLAGGAPTQGTFTLTFAGQTTGNIAFDASAATVDTQLEALSNVNAGDIVARGGPLPGDPITVEFAGQFARTNVAAMTSADTGIDNNATTSIATNTHGYDGRNGYRFMGGTSVAAPAISGVVADLLEAWQTTYNATLGTTLDANPPLPSTLRALLVQTAIDVVDNNVRGATCDDVDLDSTQGNGNDDQGFATATVGPDFATGWGRVDAAAAVNMLRDWRSVNNRRIPNRMIQDAINQGGVKEYDFVVDQAVALKVTLAWDDVEGATQNPAISPRLVNDLDLELVEPDGTVHYPWQLGHSIQDANGNPLANNAQPPGTPIQVVIPITPNVNPANDEYVPANALTGNGDWVARRGKDHLNNVEQVQLNVAANQTGHWTLRVIGFDITAEAQDYSVVGFPYPDLAEIEVSCTAKVPLSAINTPMVFTWTAENSGAQPTGAAGSTFDYQVWLSRDFVLDGSDVALTDANQAALGPLGVGASLQHTSSVQITQANADALLGAGTTIQDLQNADVFLILEVDSSDDVLEHRERNLAVIQLARPVDVVMVMDRSGSMSGNVPVSNGIQTKMQILQHAANLFLDLMRKDASDQLAEVSFSSPSEIDTIFGPSGLTTLTSNNVGLARQAVNGLQPATSTDIRGGLQRGLDVLRAGTVPGHRKTLIFFSDGKKTAGGDPTEAAFLQQFDTDDIHVYSVGFGTKGGTAYTGIDIDLLQALTNANLGEPGFFHVTESAVALDKFFVNAVAGAIDAQVVLDPEGDLAPAETRSWDIPLSRQDYAVTFILTWDNPASSLDLVVRTPSGFELSAANASLFKDRVSIIEAGGYRLLTIQFPLAVGLDVHHEGRWELVASNPGTSTAHYSASVISESTIRSEVTPPIKLSGRHFITLDKIPFLVTLRELGGKPLLGATVTIRPNVPAKSLQGVLASAKITEEELARIPKEIKGDLLSREERLYWALVQRTNGGNLLPRRDLPPFELTEEREPGEYLGYFPKTRVPGLYNFLVQIDGVTPECESFQREHNFSVLVKPDPEKQGK